MMPKADLKGRINKFSGFKITVPSQEKPYTFNIYIYRNGKEIQITIQ